MEKHKQAMHLIPDELVQNMCAAGTPDECVSKAQEYIKAGCTCPILYPVGGDVRLLVDTFAQA